MKRLRAARLAARGVASHGGAHRSARSEGGAPQGARRPQGVPPPRRRGPPRDPGAVSRLRAALPRAREGRARRRPDRRGARRCSGSPTPTRSARRSGRSAAPGSSRRRSATTTGATTSCCAASRACGSSRSCRRPSSTASSAPSSSRTCCRAGGAAALESQLEGLRQLVFELSTKLPSESGATQLAEAVAQMKDPSAIVDLVAAAAVSDPDPRQKILEEANVGEAARARHGGGRRRRARALEGAQPEGLSRARCAPRRSR